MTAHFLYKEAQEFLYATRECSELTSREKADIIMALKKIENICLTAAARDEESARSRRPIGNYHSACGSSGSSACGSTSRTSTCGSSSPRSSGCSSSSSSSGCGSSYGTGSHC